MIVSPRAALALASGLALAFAAGCAASKAPAHAPAPLPASAAEPAAPPPAPPPPMAPTQPAASASSAPIEESAVAAATGADQPEKSPDGAVKASFPRKDVEVAVDGWKLHPFMGLTSWAAFSPGKAGVAEAMVMGDLVLFEDEVNPVMSVLLDNGVAVTALHNHFLFDAPKVYFLHIGGEGTVAALGKGVKLALAKAAEIRARKPRPPVRSGAPALPGKSTIDRAKMESALGVQGVAKDGMFKATMGRQTSAACGCPIGKSMGVSTWAAFAGNDDNAVVDGDFAVTESELEPVLKSLRGAGIHIVSIHHHMAGEVPKILFLHFWGRGKAADLATAVRKALDLTAWEGAAKAS